jgi:hypothetical protein
VGPAVVLLAAFVAIEARIPPALIPLRVLTEPDGADLDSHHHRLRSPAVPEEGVA